MGAGGTNHTAVDNSLDIHRLHRALTLEADCGFANLQGRQERFAEFLGRSLRTVPATWERRDRQRAKTLAQQYAQYDTLPLASRQSLVAHTRQLLYDVRRQELSDGPPPRPSAKPAVAKPPAHLTLDTSLQYVEGVGPRLAEKLARLELHTVRDVLEYFPREHVDYSQRVAIAQLTDGQTATVVASLQRFNCFTSPKNPNLTIVEILLRDRTGSLKLNRFYAGQRFRHRAWQEQEKKRYPVGALVAAAGTVKRGKFGLTLEDFSLEVLGSAHTEITSESIGRWVPVYPLTEGVSPEILRKLVGQCLPLARTIPDGLPAALRQTYDLLPLPTAIAQVHYPDSPTMLEKAVVRLVFDKFFYRRLVALRRRQNHRAIAVLPESQLLPRFQALLPFALTAAQKRVIDEIRQDMQRPVPMNRLVQGDVGSGKTVVAVHAILAAIEAGYQAALMAPTEVLSEQHYRKIVGWFNALGLPVELLMGSTRAAKRREILQQLATGELPLVIGTHALIQEGVTFQRLGVAVIDEQHRFGRDQRSRLVQKGIAPHVLIMTATPIPRTLYLTNTEIETSIIDELPPGRQPIQTTVLPPSQRRAAYDLIRREVAQGRQAYIVLPLVEASDKLEDVRSAIEEHARLQNHVFANFRVGLLHGQMSPAEKDAAITAFRDRQTDILVATTVVEVGVDVPNATVMAIEHADRFGLAQLHQLRGRVGRGSHKSYCLLIASSKTETAQERLGVLAQSQDGFYIAERDLQLRGKGNDEGTEQSGHAGLAIEDRLPDEAARLAVVQKARQAAEQIWQEDPTLARYPQLQAEYERRDRRWQGGAIFT